MLLVTKVLFLTLTFGTYLMLSDCDPDDSKKVVHKVIKKECIDAVNSTHLKDLCCNEVLENDTTMNDCIRLSYANAPPSFVVTEEDQTKRFSIIVECIYTTKKYIKHNNRLNMKSIKAEARKLYGNNSFPIKFTINMYKDCGRKANEMLKMFTRLSRSKDLPMPLRKPYYSFVYVCVNGYSKTKCPYFRWTGKTELDEKKCSDYAAQCTRSRKKRNKTE